MKALLERSKQTTNKNTTKQIDSRVTTRALLNVRQLRRISFLNLILNVEYTSILKFMND